MVRHHSQWRVLDVSATPGSAAESRTHVRAGSTGSVNEPQVHFELRRGRTPVDPAKIIGGR